MCMMVYKISQTPEGLLTVCKYFAKTFFLGGGATSLEIRGNVSQVMYISS